jgi:ubiquinone/menaquinone biosynthesis C-methylase UbiE
MATLEMSTDRREDRATLIRRVNQLYHELAHARFDDDHRLRHRVERRFWEQVGAVALPRKSDPGRAGSIGTSGRVILDLACGTGFVSQALLPRMETADHLWAMDIGCHPLHEAMHKLLLTCGRGVRTIPCVADAQQIPLASGSVDLVAMNASLHHLPDPPQALRSVDRVLKPGGWFALGFEPNRVHFQSPVSAALSAGFNRACWYAGPRQNWRRLAQRLRIEPVAGVPNGSAGDDVLAVQINRQLISDGLIRQPLSTSDVLDLVDPYARGAPDAAGFDPDILLGSAMRKYQPVLLTCSDYLGESARRWPILRTTVDALLRKLMPAHGSLFSWLIRKPADASPRSAS